MTQAQNHDMADKASSAMKWPQSKLTAKQTLAIAVVVGASAIAHWHLTSLGEGDLFQTAEDVLALLLFW